MKRLLFAASNGMALMMGMVLTLSSCSEEVKNPADETVYAPVRVQVDEFSVSMEDFPRTRAVQTLDEYGYVGAITLAFYDANGTEVVKTTQLKSDPSQYTTYGEFAFTLPVGSYTLVAVGYGFNDGDAFSLTSPTAAAFTSAFARETFCATQSVTVTSAAPLDLSITLNRMNSYVAVLSTDQCPAGAVKVSTTFGAGSKAFSPTTGLATDDLGFSVSNSLSASAGKTININNCVFLSADEQEMDVTLQVMDGEDNVLVSKVIQDVPLKRNRVTILKGALFTPSSPSNASFTIETDRVKSITLNF